MCPLLGSARPERSAAWVRFHATGVGLAAVAALLLNPYGWRLPTEILSMKGAIYFGLAALCLASLRWIRAEKGLPALLAWSAFVILPLTAARHLPRFAIGSPILLAPHFASAAAAVPTRSRNLQTTHRMRGALIVTCFALGLLMIAEDSLRVRCA